MDNAAKIFPMTSNRTDTKVFRFYCQLKKPIDGEKLQEAVMMTLEDFPMYQSVIKRGLFWYYLEKSNIKPVVREEYREPCAPLFDKNVKRLLFEVTWYKSRINLEIHHILTDGTGAIEFLKKLVIHYLTLETQLEDEEAVTVDYDASDVEMSNDSFKKYYEKTEYSATKSSVKPVKVYRVHGQRLPGYRMQIIEGTMPVDALLKTAKSYKTTMTVFLVSLLIQSLGLEMMQKDKNKTVTINVPVNLRSFFESSTARNFFSVMQVSYNFKHQSSDLEDIIAYVSACFKNELTREKLARRMNKMGSLERNIVMRSVPLTLKDVVMKIAYDISNRKYTASLSNLGVISIPEILHPYIDMFGVFVSSDTYKACVCSYEGRIRITFTTPYEETQIQKHFFRQLAKMGMEVCVETNGAVEDEA